MSGTPTVVNDVMTRRVVALRTGAAFKEIVRTMRAWQVGALPVLDASGGVLGIVSEADLLAKEAYGEGDIGRYGQARRSADLRTAEAVTAGDLMSSPALTVPSGTSLAHAARVMARNRVKRLPVVADDGALLGIVSRSDLLKVFLRADDDIAADVRREAVLRLFGAHAGTVSVSVREGVVRLGGRVDEPALIPLAVRLARSVPGVVNVECALTGPPRRPDLDPDLPDAGDDARNAPEPPAGRGGRGR
ncbi:CBS domain-containing protein [Streptomyces sp. NPDC048566]|uniref:CBS domain-containing protein n=1 Tax=Streptomyces sp. NPDC048566 TaxID=3365569 RepID=UPI003712503B